MKQKILSKIKENGLVAVVRGTDDINAVEISEKIIEGGIKTIELTFSTRYADNAINKLSRKYHDDENILIGAGTVLDDITARIAILNGAQFVVSPHFDKKISKVCNRYSIPYLAGCGSVTEVISAIENGSDIVKIFPGGVLGSSFIKDVHGPIPYANMMPSGGVNIDNMDKWINAGAYAIGIGSALTKGGIDKIVDTTKAFVEKYNGIK